MKKHFLTISIVGALLCGHVTAPARPQQRTQTPSSSPTAAPRQTTNTPATTNRPPQVNLTQQQPQQQARATQFSLSDLGIQIEPEPRLIVMLAALDAAGWEPTPEGAEPSIFRQLVRKDLASTLDPALRARMQEFYRRHKLEDTHATPAEQAARYISLAYTLGPAPTFETPSRSDDLPPGVLDVFDFAPLLRDFYRAARMDERLPAYIQMHRAAGDNLRVPSIELGYAVLHYLNTQPVKTISERVAIEATPTTPNKKNSTESGKKNTVYRERERRFHIVPALLAAPGAINLRVIADDYYAIMSARTDPTRAADSDTRLSGLRRAYIQYLIDPLVIRRANEIALKRAEIKQVLDAERTRGGREITPDVFLTVSRSLVAATDARMEETARLRELQLRTSARLTSAARDEAARAAVLKESKEAQVAIEDASTAMLAEAYERGAVLSFYFAEQLRGIESSGFDIATFIPDMISSFTPARELSRPQEYAAAVTRDTEARRKAQQARAREAAAASNAIPDERRSTLFQRLGDVDELLRVKNYTEAEARLLSMRDEYKDEPRIYFGLGQAAGLSAHDAFDETLQAERLNRALEHYRQATLLASPETDAALLSRAYVARGRILAFLDRKEEAAGEFDAAIKLKDVIGGAYKEALAGKQELATKQP